MFKARKNPYAAGDAATLAQTDGWKSMAGSAPDRGQLASLAQINAVLGVVVRSHSTLVSIP